MTPSLFLACLWALAATLAAMMPERTHWRSAYLLIAAGIPTLGWVTYQNGPVWGLLVLAAGASMLRWPLIHLVRWLRRRGRRPDAGGAADQPCGAGPAPLPTRHDDPASPRARHPDRRPAAG